MTSMRTRLLSEPVMHAHPPPLPTKRPSRVWPRVLILLVAIVLFIIGGTVFERLTETPEERTKRVAAAAASEGTSEACVMAEKFVSRQLLSPSTAKFSGYSDTSAMNVGGGDFIVTGWVDSQNVFGATIRSTYSAFLHRSGDGWAAKNVVVSE